MLKRIDDHVSCMSKVAGELPKFYPYFGLWMSRLGQKWREGKPDAKSAASSVFNNIFKKNYSVRYRDVFTEYRGNEARHAR